jgi:hypothetical protein
MTNYPESLSDHQSTTPNLRFGVIRAKTLVATETTTPTISSKTVTKIVAVVETPALHTYRNVSRSPFVLPAQHTTPKVTEVSPGSTLTLHETTLIKRKATTTHHLTHVETPSVTLHKIIAPQAHTALVETPIQMVFYPGRRAQTLAVSQTTTPDFNHSLTYSLDISEYTHAISSYNRAHTPFVLQEDTLAKRRSNIIVDHHITETTSLHHREIATKHLHDTESTIVHRHSDPIKPHKMSEHAAVHMRPLPVSVRSSIEHTDLTSRHDVSAYRHASESTIIKRISTPIKREHVNQSHVLDLATPALSIHNNMREHLAFTLTLNEINNVFRTTQLTEIQRTANLAWSIRLAQDTTLGHRAHTLHHFGVTVTPISIVASSVTRNLIPIMGYIYQPIDQAGQLVRVISDLHDYYFWLNSDDTPSLTWNFSELSRDSTNDSYKFWRTK